MNDEELLEHLLGLEAQGLELLDATVRGALAIVAKEATPEFGAELLAKAVLGKVYDVRASVREAAAKAIGLEIGLEFKPSGADDSECSSKAGDYYAKAWAKELDEWPASADSAREKASKVLADVACCEVFDAWNDEQCRAAAVLAKRGPSTKVRWTSKQDGSVCKLCGEMHGKVADEDGLFSLTNGKRGRPPLHRRCRCIAAVRSGKSVGDETQNMSISRAQPDSSIGEKLTDAVNILDSATSSMLDAMFRKADASTISKALHVKAINADRRTVDFVASTDVVDAHDEIVEQSSWVLDDYLRNPVVLFAHSSRDLPIGKAIDVAVRNSGNGMQLEARIEFAPAALNPMAEQVFGLIQAGFLRAVSVGFIPKSGRYEMRDGAEIFVWADCVLKEISVTPVPANPEALAKMKEIAPRHSVVTREYPTPPAVPGQEPNTAKENVMDVKELQDRIEKMTAEKALAEADAKKQAERLEFAEKSCFAAEARVKALETEKSALDAQNKTLAADRDAAIARAEKAEATVIEQEVIALVGDKITPAEKDMFVELRKTNEVLFKKMIDQRQPLNLTKQIVPQNGSSNGAKSTDSEIFAELDKLGNSIV